MQRRLLTGAARGFAREEGRWVCRNGSDSVAIASWLDSHPIAVHASEPRAGSMICAPLLARDRVLGVLTISSIASTAFGLYEVDLVESFTPKVLIALRNSQRAESWEIRVLEAEKKQALANLARSVSHDVNNAVGAALPLTQQIIEDLERGRLDPETLAADLKHIEQSLRFCRRVFGGMLAFAKGNAEMLGEASVLQAVRNVLSILSDSMRRQGIRIALEVDEGLPPVRGTPGDLQQLFLNLATNARDSMPLGGVLRLHASANERSMVVTVSDTGNGMSPEQLERAFEPFFSTKPTGSGLGLATCQAIVWRVRGEIQLTSEVGRGTTVEVRLPLARSLGPDLVLSRETDHE
jgi:signal transduction histidine kinase